MDQIQLPGLRYLSIVRGTPAASQFQKSQPKSSASSGYSQAVDLLPPPRRIYSRRKIKNALVQAPIFSMRVRPPFQPSLAIWKP